MNIVNDDNNDYDDISRKGQHTDLFVMHLMVLMKNGMMTMMMTAMMMRMTMMALKYLQEVEEVQQQQGLRMKARALSGMLPECN